MNVRRRWTFAAVLLAMGLGGCAHDLPGWKVASTEHFRVYTDRKPRSFEPLLDRMEEVYAGLKSSLFSETNIPPTEVFLFGEGEFHELLGPIGGLAIRAKGKQSILVLYDGWSAEFTSSTAAHELAHAFIDATFQRVPVWFHEGLATYAESIMVQDNVVFLGSNKVHVAGRAIGRQLADVTKLFSARHRDFHAEWEATQYTTAWAVIHYLWHGEKKSLRGRFDAFGAALSNEAAQEGGSLRAWQAIYPDVPLDDLGGRLRDHMGEVFERGRDSVVGFRFVRPERPPTALAPADMSYVDEMRRALIKIRRPDKF